MDFGQRLEAAQAKEPRKVMIDVYTKWCGPCKMMMRNTFTNADVISYINENFYAVKFDAEGPDPVEFKGKTFSNPRMSPTSRAQWCARVEPGIQGEGLPHHCLLGRRVGDDRAHQWVQKPQQLNCTSASFDDAWRAGDVSGRMGRLPASLSPRPFNKRPVNPVKSTKTSGPLSQEGGPACIFAPRNERRYDERYRAPDIRRQGS